MSADSSTEVSAVAETSTPTEYSLVLPDFVHTPAPGYVGNLSEEQTAALQAFRDDIPEYIATTDDYEILRFLRARKFDVAEAKKMFVDYKVWFETKKVANILDSAPEDIELVVKLIPNTNAGHDKKGHPIYIERMGSIDPEVFMAIFSDNQILHSHIWGQEYQIRRCKNFCEANNLPVGSIDKFSTIMDLEGLGLHHKDCLKFTKLITEHDSKYYPERMGYTFIINPTFTFNFFWNIAKLWLDPVTKSKIIVCKNHADLLEYIDADQLPTRYGGTRECTTLEDPDIVAIRKDICENNKYESLYSENPVAAGTKFETRIPLKVGQTCRFSFKSSHAIIFASNFYTNDQTIPESHSAESTDSLIINQRSSLNSHELPQQGFFIPDVDGTLVLQWHNDSWWGVKSVFSYTNVADL